jgi:hypothetical protein
MWELPAEGMRGALESNAPIPTDLLVVVSFDCPRCGECWDAPLVLTYTAPRDAQRGKSS